VTGWDDEQFPEGWDEDDEAEDADDGDGGTGGDLRAPICGFCGVTALPKGTSNLIDTEFVCDNEDCDAYRETVA